MSNQPTKRSNIHQRNTTFTIKDNIVIGKEQTVPGNSLNIGNLLLERFTNNPDVIGQIDASTGKQCTHKEMMDRSIRCALWLKKQGVKQGDVVAICTSHHFDGYVPFMGALYIGAICAPEYHKLTKRDLSSFLTKVKPKVIFLHDHAVQTFTDFLKKSNMEIPRIVFEDGTSNETSLEEILAMQTSTEVNEFRCADISKPDEPAVMLSTSGTTGTSKIAVLSHLSLRAISVKLHVVDSMDQIIMCGAGLRWIPCILMMLGGIAVNSTKVIVMDCTNAKYYLEVIKKYKVTYYLTDSNQIREIYKLKLMDEYRSTNLKTILFGGSFLARHIHETMIKSLPEINVTHIYGSTELGNFVLRSRPGCQPGSCGYVKDGVKIKIANIETGETLGMNKEGELCVKTATLLCDYWNDTDKFKQCFDSDGWYHTADIAYYDENGEFYITGRLSTFIKYNDLRLSGTYVELLLEEHPAVYKAAVVGIPAEIEGEVPIAIVNKMPGIEVTEKELLKFAADNLPEYYKLHGVKFVEEFPYTLTGKIAMKELKEMLINNKI